MTRSSDVTGSVRGRGSLDAGVTPGPSFMRDNGGCRQRCLYRGRTPLRRRGCGGAGGREGCRSGGHGQVVQLRANGPLDAVPRGASTSADPPNIEIRCTNP